MKIIQQKKSQSKVLTLQAGIKLDKIPYLFKNVDLPYDVPISSKIEAVEGSFVVVKILESAGKKDDLDYSTGRLGKVVKGDIIPGVLSYRSALVEFAGTVPEKVSVGDKLSLLCESGMIGAIAGVYESWGKPIECEILGAIVDKKGKNLNLKNYTIPVPTTKKASVPIVGLLGTKMDCGKTTIGCKIINDAKNKGLKVAALKLTGAAFSQDLYKLKEFGANPVYDYVDMGLPSTCGLNAAEAVVTSTKNLITLAKASNPDLIVIEFGDAVIGKYHVADILNCKDIVSEISTFILAASDLVAVAGAKEILGKKYGIKIDMVTGPVVNSKAGVAYVKEYFNLNGESNQHEIPNTTALVDSLFKKTK